MAVEAKRGCGYRKVGGLYLVTFGAGRQCGKMPIRCEVCPTCNQGIKPARGWTWIDPAPLFGERECATRGDCGTCPLGDRRLERARADRADLDRGEVLPDAARLHEPRPRAWASAGASRRSRRASSSARPGSLFAHRKVQFGRMELAPGLFYLAQPERIEKIVTESQARDAEEMAKLAKRGITPVVVPDDDPDHNPAAGKEDDLDQLELFDAAD